MDCSPPGSSVHLILQAGVLEWDAIPSWSGSSQPRDWTWVSGIAGRFFTIWGTREAFEASLWSWNESILVVEYDLNLYSSLFKCFPFWLWFSLSYNFLPLFYLRRPFGISFRIGLVLLYSFSFDLPEKFVLCPILRQGLFLVWIPATSFLNVCCWSSSWCGVCSCV